MTVATPTIVTRTHARAHTHHNDNEFNFHPLILAYSIRRYAERLVRELESVVCTVVCVDCTAVETVRREKCIGDVVERSISDTSKNILDETESARLITVSVCL